MAQFLRTALTLALPLLSLSACATVPSSAEESWVGIGQTVRSGSLSIHTNALIEDSRCPMNARCVWAGRVVVDVTLTQDGRTTRTNLILGEPKALANGTVMLDSVEPGRETQVNLPAADYRLHFTYTG